MLSSHSTTKWLSLFTLLILLLLICDILLTIRKEYLFERKLNTLYITPDDFTAAGPSYKQALLDAGRDSFDFDFPSTAHHSNSIPPLIHYIWYDNLYPPPPQNSKRTIPSNAPELCEKYNPTFTIKIWNETEVLQLLHTDYPWFLRTYTNYAEGVQRVDAAKYFILLKHGGIYADHDISCRKGLTPLLDFAAWFPRASPLGINNDLMSARKGHPLMEMMVESLEGRDRSLVFPWLTIFWSTGPRFATDVLHEYLDGRGALRIADGYKEAEINAGIVRRGDPDSISILPASMYSEELQFFGHRPGGTWYGWDVALIRWVGGHWYVLLIRGLVVAMVACLVTMRQGWARLFRGLSSLRAKILMMKRKQDDERVVFDLSK